MWKEGRGEDYGILGSDETRVYDLYYHLSRSLYLAWDNRWHFWKVRDSTSSRESHNGGMCAPVSFHKLKVCEVLVPSRSSPVRSRDVRTCPRFGMENPNTRFFFFFKAGSTPVPVVLKRSQVRKKSQGSSDRQATAVGVRKPDNEGPGTQWKEAWDSSF